MGILIHHKKFLFFGCWFISDNEKLGVFGLVKSEDFLILYFRPTSPEKIRFLGRD